MVNFVKRVVKKVPSQEESQRVRMSHPHEEPYEDSRKCLRAAIDSVLAGSPVRIPEREGDGSKTFLGGSCRLGVTK